MTPGETARSRQFSGSADVGRGRWGSLTPAPWRMLAALFTVTFLTGCASVAPRLAVPETGFREAEVVGVPAVRTFADLAPTMAEALESRMRITLEGRVEANRARTGRPGLTVLGLSGGADDGAFGAGLLYGWTERGDRPVFDVVTGVSTGALIAPFAFVGPDYDDNLRRFFTETETADIIDPQLFSALFRNALSLGDSGPLEAEIEAAITPEFLEAVAAAHASGRRLLVATTNLDARRTVIWNMGEIASRGGPEALALFRKVILASASVPGGFPPVFIDVTLNGRSYQEMHVDGGVTTSVFIAPLWARLDRLAPDDPEADLRIYVIQNNKVEAVYGPASDQLFGVVGDSLSTMIRTQARGDHLRIFTVAQQAGFEYRVAFVPADFDGESDEPFDREYMTELFAVGRAQGLSGTAWRNEPPGLPASLRVNTDADAAETLAQQ